MKRFVVACALLSLLTACGDGRTPEEAAIEAESARPTKVVSDKVRAHRDAVVGAASSIDPQLGSYLRGMYVALDAGPGSPEMTNAGGIDRVHAELEAAELYLQLKPLDDCITRHFDLKKPDGAVRAIRRLAASDRYAGLVAEAKRVDPDGYAFDLTAYGPNPNREQRLAAAMSTLSVEARTTGSARKSADGVAMLARLSIAIASVSDGRCVPSPELLAGIRETPGIEETR